MLLKSNPYHLISQHQSGRLIFLDNGVFTGPGSGTGGHWSIKANQLHLTWPDGTREALNHLQNNIYIGKTSKIVPCRADVIGAWHTFDPSLKIYQPLCRRELLITTTWSDRKTDLSHYDLVLSGENADVSIVNNHFHFKHLQKSGIAGIFIGLPKINHPNAFHLPHFYDYWSRLVDTPLVRQKPEFGISFVASNLGKFGLLSKRRLQIAKDLSRWFPLHVSSTLKNEFLDCPRVTVWDVPWTPTGKYDFISRFRYHLCFENSVADGYLTEKPFDAIYSGVLPVYDGDPGIGSWLDSHAFINCRGLTSDEIAERILEAERENSVAMVWEKRESLISPGLEEMSARLEHFMSRFDFKERNHQPLSSTSSLITNGADTLSVASGDIPSKISGIMETKEDNHPLSNLTVVIKTIFRPDTVWQSMMSFIRILGENVPIIIVDDSENPIHKTFPPQVKYIKMPFDSGLSSGRNRGVAEVNTKYVLVSDDDNQLMSPLSLLQACIEKLDEGWDLVGANALDFYFKRDVLEVREVPVTGLFRQCDATDNFFIARTELLREHRWDERIKIGYEHSDFFLRLHKAGKRVLGTGLLYFRTLSWNTSEYSRVRSRRQYLSVYIEKWGFKDHWQRSNQLNHEKLRYHSALTKRSHFKIHLSIGGWAIGGWLNAGLLNGAGLIESLDLRKCPYPWTDESASHIFLNRVLEQLSFPTAVRILHECWKLLKPGGILRICTFNLDFLRDVFDQASDLYSDYIRWITDNHIPLAQGYDPAFVTNHIIQERKYSYMFDATILCSTLEELKFVDLKFFPPGRSDSETMTNLEDELNMPAGMSALESLVIECRKPAVL